MQKYLLQFIPGQIEGRQKTGLKILDTPNEQTIPLYDLSIAAGSFSDQQRVENIKHIELEELIPKGDNLFACKVVGESMNKVIPSGSICLFEKYSGGSRNGRIVLVEMTDFTDPDSGSNYTIKEYTSKKSNSEEGWKHEEIVLLPKSTENYPPIILRDEEIVGLKVVGLFVKVLA